MSTPSRDYMSQASLEGKSFFQSLFDISFSSFITTRIIKVLYVLFMIVIGLAYIGFVISSFANSVVLGIIVLVIIGPIVALLYLIVIRIYLELVMVIFRIADNTQRIAGETPATPLVVTPQTSAPPTEPPPTVTPPEV